jgi:hypothetical protein
MGFFGRKDEKDTSNDWNKELKNNGFTDKDNEIECNKNYQAQYSDDELKYKRLEKESNQHRVLKDTFEENKRDNNTKLQKEQIKEVRSKEYVNKDAVKEDLKDVRENTSRWKLW